LKSTVWRATVIALVLGGLLPLAYSSANCVSVSYRNGQDPAAFYSLPYEKQKEWLRENEVRVTGLTCLGQRVRSWDYWQEYLVFSAVLVVLVFIACLLMARWERLATRSNLPVERDGPKAARPSQ
jgi:hypothetical protein